jgi:hypothetical protein
MKNKIVVLLTFSFLFAKGMEDESHLLESLDLAVQNINETTKIIKDHLQEQQTIRNQMEKTAADIKQENANIAQAIADQKTEQDTTQAVLSKVSKLGNLPLRFRWRYDVLQALNRNAKPQTLKNQYTFNNIQNDPRYQAKLIDADAKPNQESAVKLQQALQKLIDAQK